MILYTIGDSVSWGAELKNKSHTRFSKLISNHLDAVDCNYASAGVSNCYIFRNTLRDVMHWINTNKIWCEDYGWVESKKLKVLIGWTAPTRFEWWDGERYIQDRLWADYDKWGNVDSHLSISEQDKFIINQTDLMPSYIRTYNYIHSIKNILENYKIDYYFFNTFYEYEYIEEPQNRIDNFGRNEKQICLDSIKIDMKNMYQYLYNNGGTFYDRKHPTEKSHKLWADFIIKDWL